MCPRSVEKAFLIKRLCEAEDPSTGRGEGETRGSWPRPSAGRPSTDPVPHPQLPTLLPSPLASPRSRAALGPAGVRKSSTPSPPRGGGHAGGSGSPAHLPRGFVDPSLGAPAGGGVPGAGGKGRQALGRPAGAHRPSLDSVASRPQAQARPPPPISRRRGAPPWAQGSLGVDLVSRVGVPASTRECGSTGRTGPG